jgi:signal transduction histidine kinase
MKLITLLVAIVGLRLASHAAVPPITRVAEVRALSVEDAARNLPVKLKGVITFYAPEWSVAFLQDDTGGIFIRLHVRELPLPLPQSGDRIEVDGFTMPGRFAPIVEGAKGRSVALRITGKGPLPVPRNVTGAQLAEPARDCDWVQVRALIRALDLTPQRPTLELDVDGRRFHAQVRAGTPLDRLSHALLGTPVLVRGVAATVFNNERQMTGRVLYLPSLDCIEAESGLVSEDLFALPLRPMNSLLRAEPGSIQERVRVRGVVTAPVPGLGMYLRGEGGGLWVQTARPDPAELGDLVEAVGWPEVAPFKPELRAAIFRNVGHLAVPAPNPVMAKEAIDGRHHADLVTVEGWLVGQQESAEGVRLLLRTDDSIFEARVGSGAQSVAARALPGGGRLRVTGICLVTPTLQFNTSQTGTTFVVQTRSAADLELLARPPWWTPRRFLWVVGGTLALAALLFAWALVLRRQVAAQTAVIRHQLKRESVLEERQRIARELHDTLEQELAGVAMQLDNTARRLDTAPGAARTALESAQRMLRYSRAESRSSIRDLRSLTLESRGLPAAMDELLRMLAEAAGVPFQIEVHGTPCRMPATFETQLLRLAHEAVANAAKHAKATRISVRLDYDADMIRLTVRDDGQGFCPNANGAAVDHFGLLGMQERADQIGGELVIESSPGAGTCIRVSAPLSPVEQPA